MNKIKITKSSGNVFKDLGFSEHEAANLLIRADLAIAIREHIKKKGLTQTEAAGLMKIKQPDVSAITSGKIDKFTIDYLVNALVRLGHSVKVTSSKHRHSFSFISKNHTAAVR